MSKVKITKRSKYGYDIFDIEGDISYEESQILEDTVKNNLSGKFPNIILNLARVPFINSSALALFVKLQEALAQKKINLYIMSANQTILGLFRITGSEKYFKIIRDEETLSENVKYKELDKVLDIDD